MCNINPRVRVRDGFFSIERVGVAMFTLGDSSIFLRLWLSRRWQLPGRHESKYFSTNWMNLNYWHKIRAHNRVFTSTAFDKVSETFVSVCLFSVCCVLLSQTARPFFLWELLKGRLSKRWLLPETAWNTATQRLSSLTTFSCVLIPLVQPNLYQVNDACENCLNLGGT